jgi:fluoride exporter
MIQQILLVGAGGFVGAVARFGVTALLNGKSDHAQPAFPWGTLTANVLGCLLISVLFAVAEQRQSISDEARLVLATGFLGSFTTFSTFGYETVALLRGGHSGMALGYMSANLVLGLLAVVGGHAAVKGLAG